MSSATATSPPAIKSIVPWHGSKRRLAETIVEELGTHNAFWDPMCGGLSVILSKRRSSMETINDLHTDLTNLAFVLASEFCGTLYERLSRVLMSDAMFEQSKGLIAVPPNGPDAGEGVRPSHVDRAYFYMIYSWMGRNGVSGTAMSNITLASRFTSNGGSGGVRWKSAVDSIPAWHERLRTVNIRNMDAFTMLERIEDSAKSAIYVDPPYLKKSTQYLHDLTRDDHARLAALLRRFQQTRVVISYYDDPWLDELYPNWTKRDVAISKSLASQRRRGQAGTVKAPEVLLMNGPSFHEDGGFL